MEIPLLDWLATLELGAEDLPALVGLRGGDAHSSIDTGSKALMLAVLDDAIRVYLDSPSLSRDEAEAWIRSNRRWLFSFVGICEALGLEPSSVRSALRRLRAKNTGPKVVGRTRPNGRRVPRQVG